MNMRAFCWIAVSMFATSVGAQEPEWTPLWSEGAPGAKGTAEQDIPAIQHFAPESDKANGCAFVICPGGGYGHLALDHEGRQVAQWLTDRGIHAYVLRYRLGKNGYHHPTQSGDVQRAIRTVRAGASGSGIDPSRIGVWGFSAGGHLASTAATHFAPGTEGHADPIERVSSRPDFAVLCYPVISMTDEVTHKGSRTNLFGPGRVDDAQLIELLSNENRVNAETPPTFLFHTLEDTAVPVENSLRFFAALRKAGNSKSELHVYQKGRHGLGLAASDPVLGTWPDRVHGWLKVNGWVP